MAPSMELIARLEGAANVVEAGGVAYTYRHPTQAQIAASMALAGVSQDEISEASEGRISDGTIEAAAKMERAYELLGALCVEAVDPAPCDPLRERNRLGLLQLTEAAQVALSPQIGMIGEYLIEKSTVSDVEGKD